MLDTDFHEPSCSNVQYSKRVLHDYGFIVKLSWPSQLLKTYHDDLPFFICIRFSELFTCVRRNVLAELACSKQQYMEVSHTVPNQQENTTKSDYMPWRSLSMILTDFTFSTYGAVPVTAPCIIECNLLINVH